MPPVRSQFDCIKMLWKESSQQERKHLKPHLDAYCANAGKIFNIPLDPNVAEILSAAEAEIDAAFEAKYGMKTMAYLFKNCKI